MTAKLDIKVSPGASANAIGGWMGNRLRIRVNAPPEKGKANKAVIALLSKVLKIPESAMSITRGATASSKTIEIDGLSTEELYRKLYSGDMPCNHESA